MRMSKGEEESDADVRLAAECLSVLSFDFQFFLV